jgi:hypothetical protein
MKTLQTLVLSASLLLAISSHAQEKIDTAFISKIKDEGLNRSKVVDMLGMLTDVYGPRLSFSPGYKNAASYAKQTMESFGLSNAQFDTWDEMGRGWFIKKFNIQMVEPSYTPLTGYPKAWSPGLKKSTSAEVVYIDASSEGDLEKYKGKLKGKIIMMDAPPAIKFGFSAIASRLPDSTLLKYANDMERRNTRRYTPSASEKITFQKWKFCMNEGVLAGLAPSTGRGDNGVLQVTGSYLPISPEIPRDKRPRIISPEAPATLPQVALSSEHYNRLYRLLERGQKVNIELTLNVEFLEPEAGFNVIAEIPGTDLKDEVVMIGAHLDSWHSGTGTTDNGVGSAVCMEAMRILKTLGVQPRRTIRIALWGCEEQGLLGSRGYVRKHLGNTVEGERNLQPEASKLSVYFNMDNGTGKFRGIYLQQNEKTRGMFREWFKPFHAMDAATLASFNTGSTDHIPFDAIGVPAFQFIQDPIEYSTRTHHTSIDVFDKAIEKDLKQNAVIMASFAWLAATRDELIPRK